MPPQCSPASAPSIIITTGSGSQLPNRGCTEPKTSSAKAMSAKFSAQPATPLDPTTNTFPKRSRLVTLRAALRAMVSRAPPWGRYTDVMA